MKPRQIVLTFSAALLLALGALAAACGGGGEGLSLQEYFQQFDAIQKDAEARFEALATPDPQATREEIAAVFLAFIKEAVAINGDTRDALADLDPPAEVKDAHNEFVGALGEAVEVTQGLSARIPDALSLAEAEALFSELFAEPEAAAAFQRFSDACLALQDVADQNNIAVDLACGG